MPEPNLVKVGVAQRKITPPLGCHLGGYFYDRVAKSVKTDLYSRVLVLDDGRKRVAVVANDLICVTAGIVEPAKALIQQRCGLDPNAVMVCATHTHTGPEIRYRKELTFGADPAYNAELTQNLAAVVEDACRAMFDAAVYVGQTEAEGYTFNRLQRTVDGQDEYCTSPRPEDAGRFVGPAGPVDTSVQVLAVRDLTKRVRGLAVNFAGHPNAKGDDIWAEWPGETACCLSAVYGEDVPCLVLQGTSGDVDCVRGLRRENIGKAVAGAAMLALERAVLPLACPVVDFQAEVLTIPYCTRTPELAARMDLQRKRTDLAPLDQIALTCYEAWDKDGKSASVPVQCLRVGDVAFVGLPAEVFTALGLEIKRRSPAKQTFVVSCANEKFGYIPPADQADRGAYGELPTQARYLVAEAGPIMVESALKSLQTLWRVS